MEVVDELRYLGIQLGHISAARAYAPALGKIMGRIQSLRMPLDLSGKIEIFKI